MKTRLKRDFFFLASISFRFLAPVLYILIEFGAFKKKYDDVIVDGGVISVPKYQFQWWELVIIMFVLWAVIYFFQNLTVLVRDMKEGFFREMLNGLTMLFIPLMLWSASNMPLKFVKEFKQFTWYFLIFSLLGLVCHALFNYYRRRTLIERGYVNVIKS